jgi:hypothetical protein
MIYGNIKRLILIHALKIHNYGKVASNPFELGDEHNTIPFMPLTL